MFNIQSTANQITPSIAFRLSYYSAQGNQTLGENYNLLLDALHYIGFAYIYVSRYCVFSTVQWELNHLQPSLKN